MQQTKAYFYQSGEVSGLSLRDPGADHVSARLTELLPLPLAEKQRLFEMPDPVERLRRLAGLIAPDAVDDAPPS